MKKEQAAELIREVSRLGSNFRELGEFLSEIDLEVKRISAIKSDIQEIKELIINQNSVAKGNETLLKYAKQLQDEILDIRNDCGQAIKEKEQAQALKEEEIRKEIDRLLDRDINKALKETTANCLKAHGYPVNDETEKDETPPYFHPDRVESGQSVNEIAKEQKYQSPISAEAISDIGAIAKKYNFPELYLSTKEWSVSITVNPEITDTSK